MSVLPISFTFELSGRKVISCDSGAAIVVVSVSGTVVVVAAADVVATDPVLPEHAAAEKIIAAVHIIAAVRLKNEVIKISLPIFYCQVLYPRNTRVVL